MSKNSALSQLTRNFVHDQPFIIESRVKSGNFVDRKPNQKPVLCIDGTLRHPFYVTDEMRADLNNLPTPIKIFS